MGILVTSPFKQKQSGDLHYTVATECLFFFSLSDPLPVNFSVKISQPEPWKVIHETWTQ